MMISTKVKESDLDKLIQEILDLKLRGDFSCAIEKAEALTSKYYSKASVFGLLASLFFEIEQYDKSIIYFRKTIEISTKSETASLGLFHSLWSLGEKEKAWEEMRRFQEMAKSEEYDNLQLELKGFEKE